METKNLSGTPLRKPAGILEATKCRGSVWYSGAFTPDCLFTIRGLDLPQDLELIHSWVNRSEAKTFWQMEGGPELVLGCYGELLKQPFFNSFIGLLNNEPVCQLDAYYPQYDEVGDHYPAEPGDLGIHLLMGKRLSYPDNLSTRIVSAFCSWFFEHREVRRIIAEPDHRNRPATWLLRRLGFDFLGNVPLKEKTAALFIITQENFTAFKIAGQRQATPVLLPA